MLNLVVILLQTVSILILYRLVWSLLNRIERLEEKAEPERRC